MTPPEPRMTLGILDNFATSTNMGAIWYITRTIYSRTKENCLSNRFWNFAIAEVFP